MHVLNRNFLYKLTVSTVSISKYNLIHPRLYLVNLNLVNRFNLVNKRGLTTTFTKSSLGCLIIFMMMVILTWFRILFHIWSRTCLHIESRTFHHKRFDTHLRIPSHICLRTPFHIRSRIFDHTQSRTFAHIRYGTLLHK